MSTNFLPSNVETIIKEKNSSPYYNQRSYPYIITPKILETIASEYPPSPSLELPPKPPKPIVINKPKHPGQFIQKPPSKIEYVPLMISGVLAAIFSGIVGNYFDSLAGILTFICLFFGVGLWGFFQVKSYPDRLSYYRMQKKQHQDLINEYSRKLIQWENRQQEQEQFSQLEEKKWQQEVERKKHEYNQIIKQLHNPKYLEQWRKQKFLDSVKLLNPSSDGEEKNQKMGWCEPYFDNYLNQYFSGYIYKNIILQNPNYDKVYHYTADFSYIDKQFNVWIDIEVDEPYAYQSGQPTHYLELHNEQERDNYYQKKDWFVIRFSEEQVAKYPHNCCRYIADVIAQIKGVNSIPASLQNVNPVTPSPRWTKSEAELMAQQNYRNSYTKLCKAY